MAGIVTYTGPGQEDVYLPSGTTLRVVTGNSYTLSDTDAAAALTLPNFVAGDQHTANLSPLYVPTSTARGQFSLARFYGHSIGAGGGASGNDTNGGSVVASYFGVPDSLNLSIGGSYLARDSTDGNNGGVSWIAQREQRVIRKAPYMAALDLCILHFGYEDLMAGLASTLNNPVAQANVIFQNALRSALSIVRSSARFYAGDKTTNLDASISLGTPANWTPQGNPAKTASMGIPPSYAGSVGIVATSTNGAGGAFTITIPGDYPGSAVCPLTILFYVNGSTAGTLTASGAATGTFDIAQTVSNGTPPNTPGTYDAVNNKGNIIAWRFTGNSIAASNGATQTLTVTPSGVNGFGYGLCEWLIEAMTPPTVVIPLMDVLGNPGILVFQGTRASDCASMNAVITALVANEFNDGTVFTCSYSLGGSGNTYGLNGTAGNSVAATADTSTGLGGLGTANCKVNTVAAWPTSGSAMVGTEIISWTGVSQSAGVATLSGVTRGAYNTTAVAHTGSPLIDTLNVGTQPQNSLATSGSGIAMYSSDATHLSDLGYSVVAQSIINAIQSTSLDTRARVRSSRARTKVKGIWQSALVGQIIPPQGGFDGQYGDTLWDLSVVDSTTAMRSLANLLSGSFATASITANGDYVINVSGYVTVGKGTSGGGTGAATGGTFRIRLQVNGTTVAVDARSFAAADYTGVFFPVPFSFTFGPIELHNGDQVKLVATQSGVGAYTSVSDNPLTSGATTINLAATAGMAANDVLRIDNEMILIGTVSTGTRLTGCTRGYAGSTAAQHSSAAAAYTGRWLYGAGSTVTPSQLTIQRISAF